MGPAERIAAGTDYPAGPYCGKFPRERCSPAPDGLCGLLVLRSGRLRAYVLSQDGREVTLYRLTAGEICLFSASCVLGTAQMDLTVEAEQDSTVWVIPPDVFRQIAHESAAAAGYVNTLMARRFSEVMWLVEQVMWQSMDRRLAAFLLEESALEHTDTLHLTHEQIANHLGTAREVVTRMLRYFPKRGNGASEPGNRGHCGPAPSEGAASIHCLNDK